MAVGWYTAGLNQVLYYANAILPVTWLTKWSVPGAFQEKTKLQSKSSRRTLHSEESLFSTCDPISWSMRVLAYLSEVGVKHYFYYASDLSLNNNKLIVLVCRLVCDQLWW